MEKKKKGITISILTIAIMIPIIGRLIGQYTMQKEHSSNKELNEIIDEFNARETQRVKIDYEECKEDLKPYTMMFEEKKATMVDRKGKRVIESVSKIEYINFRYYLIADSNSSYMFNTKTKTLSSSNEVANKVYVKKEKYDESAILYKTSKSDKTWNLQTLDKLYKNVEGDYENYSGTLRFDVSSGNPKVIE